MSKEIMNVNARIKHIRLIIGLSQKAFAQRIGVSQNKIARIEINKITPHLSIINNICAVYDVNLMWLNSGVGAIFNDGSDIFKQMYELKNDLEETPVSQLMSIDRELLEGILTGIDNFLDSRNKTLKNEYKAQLAARLYLYFEKEIIKEEKEDK